MHVQATAGCLRAGISCPSCVCQKCVLLRAQLNAFACLPPALCKGGVAECGWSLSLPVLDPACLLSLAVFQQPSRADRSASPAVLRQGLRVRCTVI